MRIEEIIIVIENLNQQVQLITILRISMQGENIENMQIEIELINDESNSENIKMRVLRIAEN